VADLQCKDGLTAETQRGKSFNTKDTKDTKDTKRMIRKIK
jgi:hypothetical protein